MRHRRNRVRKDELAFPSWGGPRRGAGRKSTEPRRRVSHRTRDLLEARHPVHITVRLHERLPSLRRDAARAVIEGCFHAARKRDGFCLAQYSLQSNHMHLIAEADDRSALSRGMQGLLVRIARALNRLWVRKGTVFADRYHARQLRTPREVRAALVYVLLNARHHGLPFLGVDLYSSGRWFDGWSRRVVFASRSAVAMARTWLLRVGWRRHGLIGLGEVPRGASP
jgi:putative transposase